MRKVRRPAQPVGRLLPSVWPGDTVEVGEYPLQQLRRGDIVLAIRDGRLFLHRFVRHWADGGFVLRGDSMTKADRPYLPDAFLGRMVRDEGRSPMLAALWRLCCRAVGLVIAHVGIARRIAMRLHGWWTRGAEKEDTLASISRGDA